MKTPNEILARLAARLRRSCIAPVVILLAWDHNATPVPDLVGYRLYRGTAPGAYSESADVGKTNRATVHALPGTNYFAVTAYTTRAESALTGLIYFSPPASASATMAVQVPQNGSGVLATIQAPTNGTVTLTGGKLIYTPRATFTGKDSVGLQWAGPPGARFNVTVAASPPLVAFAKTLTVTRPATLNGVVLQSSGAVGSVTYFITTPPSNGVVLGLLPNLIYRPKPAPFLGVDTLWYRAVSGSVTSAPAKVAIVIK